MFCCRWAGPGCREGNLGELRAFLLSSPHLRALMPNRTVPVRYIFFQPYLKYYSSLC